MAALYPGSKFRGEQRSSSQAYKVYVTLQVIDCSIISSDASKLIFPQLLLNIAR